MVGPSWEGDARPVGAAPEQFTSGRLPRQPAAPSALSLFFRWMKRAEGACCSVAKVIGHPFWQPKCVCAYVKYCVAGFHSMGGENYLFHS